MVGTTRVYDNYLFGSKAVGITDVNNCSIARGSVLNTEKTPFTPYKQSLFSEANSAFDVYTTPESMKLYEKDGEKRIDCGPDDSNPDTYLTDTYWGKNIITNADTSNWTLKEPSWLREFYQPIFSLAGMKEVYQDGAEVEHENIAHLPPEAKYGSDPLITNTPIYCNAAYSGYPYMLQAGWMRRDGPWPDDEGKSEDDISCKTEQEMDFRQPTWV